MILDRTITQDFIEHCDEKGVLYSPRGRSYEQKRMDIEAEIHEFYQIKTGEWEDEPNDWRIDAHIPSPDGYQTVDVKFIKKWYNISNHKMWNIIQQRKVLDGYLFCEWINRPDRILKEGDIVTYEILGFVTYEELLDQIQISRGKWGGHYADIRGFLG